MIQKTYHNDNPEDRAYLHDYWSWLQNQPQDAWLLWAKWANWDNAAKIFDWMVDRPDCDLAVLAWIFWGSTPGTYFERPHRYETSLIARIVRNLEQGFYGVPVLFCDRYEIAIDAHEYQKALRAAAGPTPFRLPRQLCGPFGEKRASLPARYDAQTEQDLAEIFNYMDGGLPRSEDDHHRDRVACGNLWIRDHLRLPRVPRDPISAYRDLDDADFVQAMFGKTSAYLAARKKAAREPKKWRFWR